MIGRSDEAIVVGIAQARRRRLGPSEVFNARRSSQLKKRLLRHETAGARSGMAKPLLT